MSNDHNMHFFSLSLQQICIEYLEYLGKHKGLKESTLWLHRRWLTKFEKFMQSSLPTSSAVHLIAYIDSFLNRLAKEYSRRTIIQAVGVLRGFFRYQYLMGSLTEDISYHIPYPLTYRHMELPKYYAWNKVEKILLSINRSSLCGIRDYAIILLIASYGLRAGEVATLRMDDIDWKRKTITIKYRKGSSKPLILPLKEDVARAIAVYLKEVRPLDCESRHIFLCGKDFRRPFPTGSHLSIMVCSHIKQAGLPPGGVHRLRHSFAKHLRDQGVCLPVIAILLGHADMDTTAKYIRISMEDLREVTNNYAELL